MGVAMSQRLGGLTPCEMNERFIDAFSTSLAFAGCVDGTHRGRQPAVMLLYKGVIDATWSAAMSGRTVRRRARLCVKVSCHYVQ
jgi:hypothetical protein